MYLTLCGVSPRDYLRANLEERLFYDKLLENLWEIRQKEQVAIIEANGVSVANNVAKLF